jgi:nucleoside-diphosphate kinase
LSERTLVIIKPDGVQRGLVGPILTRLENRGLKIAAMKFLQVPESLAKRHYAVHEGKPFYPGLIEYISSGPVVVAAFEGKDAVAVVRSSVGATNPASAAPGTIRGDFALEIGRNLIHASDSPENAQTELDLWFNANELVTWTRSTERWILEEDG